MYSPQWSTNIGKDGNAAGRRSPLPPLAKTLPLGNLPNSNATKRKRNQKPEYSSDYLSGFGQSVAQFVVYLFLKWFKNKGGISWPKVPKIQALSRLGWPPILADLGEIGHFQACRQGSPRAAKGFQGPRGTPGMGEMSYNQIDHI